MNGSQIFETIFQGLLLAQKVTETQPTPRPTFLGAVVFGVVTFVAILVLWWHWNDAHDEIEPDRPDDLLASFLEAHEAGEIDDAELARVREQLQQGSAGVVSAPGRRKGPTEGE
jgi:hypothetical protein